MNIKQFAATKFVRTSELCVTFQIFPSSPYVDTRTNVWYHEDIATLDCVDGGDDNMDYKTLIIEMLDKLDEERYLQYIYQLIKAFLADD